MERTSIIYKTRRKIQILAHKLIPDDVLSGIYYRIVLKERLNIENPQTFNEKIQWCKLYYYPNSDLVINCADKYAVRSYIAEKGYGDKLTHLIAAWDSSREINWEELPNEFVLKCTHGCAYNIICKDPSREEKKQIGKQLDKWLNEDFGAFNVELHYSKITHRRIICEEFLGDFLTDYKFFCFNGVPKFVYVSNDLIHDRQAKIGFFNLDGSKIPLTRDDYVDIPKVSFPVYFLEMLNMAYALAADFPFVRVDFFVTNETYYFAELTFTPGAGMMPFNPKSYDLEWGKLLDISQLRNAYEANK